MKTFRWITVPIIALFTMGVIAAAQAEDFIFTVPLKLNSLHSEVGSVRVFCQARSASGTTIGGGNTIVPVGPAGHVSQDVVVSFNALPNRLASDATNYRCWFDLQSKGDSLYYEPNYGTMVFNKSKPGTPFVPVVTGQISKGASATTVSPSLLPAFPK